MAVARAGVPWAELGVDPLLVDFVRERLPQEAAAPARAQGDHLGCPEAQAELPLLALGVGDGRGVRGELGGDLEVVGREDEYEGGAVG